MPSYVQAAGLLLAAWAATVRVVQADCPDLPGCDSLGPPPIGNPGGLDPKDPNALGVYALNCPCYVGEVLDCSVTYTGTDGGVTSETTRTVVTFANSQSTIIYSFTGAATAIQSGSPISIQFGARGANYPFVSQIYSPVPSIFYTDTTTTTVATATATVTSTSTVSTTTTSSIPQQTSTVPCTTGTLTQTAATSTTTQFSTITPPPRTVTRTKTVKTTKHANCVSCKAESRRSPAERREDYMLLEERQAPFVAETLWFPAAYGAPTSTYITTATETATSTSTSTTTATVTTTSTDGTTVTPTPVTTTVCSNVAATVFTTPTVTATSTITKQRSTVTSTCTAHSTRTVYPHYPPPVCTRPPSPRKHTLSGHVLHLGH